MYRMLTPLPNLREHEKAGVFPRKKVRIGNRSMEAQLNMAEIEIAILECNALSDEVALHAPACWPWKPNATHTGAVLGFQFTRA